MAESFERNTALNIYQRINAVMAEVEAIEPDKEIKIGSNGSIPYLSHDGVTGHVKGLFVKHGIAAHPTVAEHSKDGNRTELVVDVDFVNIDKPDDRMTIRSVGYGVDSSDKGPGKAWSYAVKYAYLKALMLNSADDQGGEQVDHDPASIRESEVVAAGQMTKAALEAAANTYKAGISGASDAKQLRELKASNSEWLDAAPEVTQNYFNNIYNERLAELKAQEKI